MRYINLRFTYLLLRIMYVHQVLTLKNLSSHNKLHCNKATFAENYNVQSTHDVKTLSTTFSIWLNHFQGHCFFSRTLHDLKNRTKISRTFRNLWELRSRHVTPSSFWNSKQPFTKFSSHTKFKIPAIWRSRKCYNYYYLLGYSHGRTVFINVCLFVCTITRKQMIQKCSNLV